MNYDNYITTQVKCWKIKLIDGDLIGITENITDFIYEDLLYKSNFNLSDSKEISNLEGVQGSILNFEQIISKDIALGKLDGALIKIFSYDYHNHIEMFEIRSGILSKVQVIDGKFFFNIIPTVKSLNSLACKYYSRTCRASFCDNDCGLNKEDYTLNGIILHIDNNKIFSELFFQYEDGFFNESILEIDNIKYLIDFHSKNFVYIKFFNPNKLSNSLDFKVFLNCDKEFSSCRDKYSNAINFRGEPFLKS